MLNKLLELFSKPSLAKVQQQSLYEAEHALENHTLALEYHRGQVEMLTARIARLKQLNQETANGHS